MKMPAHIFYLFNFLFGIKSKFYTLGACMRTVIDFGVHLLCRSKTVAAAQSQRSKKQSYRENNHPEI